MPFKMRVLAHRNKLSIDGKWIIIISNGNRTERSTYREANLKLRGTFTPKLCDAKSDYQFIGSLTKFKKLSYRKFLVGALTIFIDTE